MFISAFGAPASPQRLGKIGQRAHVYYYLQLPKQEAAAAPFKGFPSYFLLYSSMEQKVSKGLAPHNGYLVPLWHRIPPKNSPKDAFLQKDLRRVSRPHNVRPGAAYINPKLSLQHGVEVERFQTRTQTLGVLGRLRSHLVCALERCT